MMFLSGLPQYLLIAALTYLVAASQSRLVAFGVCGVMFVWLLVSLRREARR